jgi:hypothetical protein
MNNCSMVHTFRKKCSEAKKSGRKGSLQCAGTKQVSCLGCDRLSLAGRFAEGT